MGQLNFGTVTRPRPNNLVVGLTIHTAWNLQTRSGDQDVGGGGGGVVDVVVSAITGAVEECDEEQDTGEGEAVPHVTHDGGLNNEEKAKVVADDGAQHADQEPHLLRHQAARKE